MNLSYRILFATCLVLSAGVLLGADTADTIYHNGTILTINDAQPTAEAVAVKDGRIIAVGTQDVDGVPPSRSTGK